MKPTTNPARRDAVFCAVFVMLVLAVPFAVGGRPALPAAFQDDAFYYARIARNVARGYGLTFDGLHATSGFHPLWLVVLVPLFAAWSGPLTPLAAALVLQILLAGAAAALTVATLGRVVGRWPAIAGGVVLAAVPRTGASLTGGLEGALTLASVALGWRLVIGALERPRAAPFAWAAPGIALALAGLARLEAFAFVPVAAAIALLARRGERPLACVTVLCLPAALAGGAIVLSCSALTATWLPISGMVKAAGRMDSPGERALGLGLGAVLAAAAIAGALALARRAGTSTLGTFVFPMLGALLWISADLATVGRLEPWNRVPVLLLAAAAVAALSFRGGGRVAVAVVGLIAVARIGLVAVRGPVAESSYGPYRWAAGAWLREHAGADDRIGSWNAGTIGYASDRHVVNLDGLVNDRAYFDEVIRGKALAAYLRRERISWIADQACGTDPTAAGYFARTGSDAVAGRLELAATFYDRSAPDGCPGVAVWRLRAE